MNVHTENCTQRQIEILWHALGLRNNNHIPYRNHFLAYPDSDDMPDLEELEACGLMKRTRTPKFCDSNSIVFNATDTGRVVALNSFKPPKHTRYDEWLATDNGQSFGRYLLGPWGLPQFEFRYVRTEKGEKTRKQWRMFRCDLLGRCEIIGNWDDTKKASKASYKAALKAYQTNNRNHNNVTTH